MTFGVKSITSPLPRDCGPTCLQMLLAYYGQDIPLEQLSRECHVDMVGSNMTNLSKCGRSHGLDMKNYQSDAKGAYTADRPVILWWRKKHFVVFDGIDDDGKIVIVDPDLGRYRMSKTLFAFYYSGKMCSNGQLPEEQEGESENESGLEAEADQ